jgi:hypothetical protein
MKLFYAPESNDNGHVEYYALMISETSSILFTFRPPHWLVQIETNMMENLYIDTKEITVTQIKNRKIKKYIKSNVWLLDIPKIREGCMLFENLL